MSDSAFSPGRESMLRNHSIFSVRSNAGAADAENPARALHRSVSLANTESPVCSNEIKEAEQEVKEIIKEANLVHPDRLDSEVSWFFHRLGIDPFYFRSMPPITVAEHITALYAAKLLNVTTSEKSLSLRLHQEKETGAMYVVPSMNRNVNDPTPNPSERIEYRIEREYLREGYDLPTTSYPGPGDFRVQVYRSSGTVSESSTTKLRLFFVQRTDFPHGDTKIDPSAPFQLEDVSDKTFYATISDSSKRIVTDMLQKAQKQQGPVIQVFDPEWSTLYGDTTREEVRLIVAYRQNSTHSFFSGLTALYHSHGLRSTRKYIEPFANGYYTYSLYLFRDLSVTRHAPSVPLKQIAQYVADDASLIYVLPRTSLFELFTGEVLTASEVSYAYALWKFAHQFFSAMADEDFANLTSQVSSQATRGLLSKVRAGLRREVMTEGRVKDVVLQHASIIKLLYADFHAKFQPVSAEDGSASQSEYHDQSEDILAKAKRAANTDLEIKILTCMCQFNRHVLKTNFFKTGKVALSFRLDPQFLARSSEYPTVPYAVFFVVGAEFRGFHIRFVDIARGGIRVIRSANEAAFAMNVSTLFEENYNLAHTQQRKNKDIPEGGSKGTILLSKEHQDKSLLAFKKYVDALLDLLLADPQVRDYHNQEELLFLGPDEGTADYMDWASLHAKERGYKFWKAFTTGKARALGGIPHDYYGMTTRSIHQFVLGILRKNNLEESTLRKFQTGGPDGDLGSNEIKISKDRTIGIVDGSGVLYDPQGIDRTELLRLAGSRLTSDHFDQSKLSKDGFFVNIQDNDKALPNGTCIDSGLIFRNTFHLLGEYLFGTDLFVPCGGRPAAVNINNVHLLFDSVTNAPMFKYIVEGANLFFTQDARLQLEKWGVTLFKDASANKGGVTSSSLEVLAALAFTDEEFEQHMQVRDPENVPAFYQQYVEEVQRIIEKHARDEFECLWREHELRNGKVPFCVLSDQLSEKINQLNLAIFSSSLWDNESLREKVISSALPRNLIELLGKDTVLTRVPDSYLHAIFSANLACQFVYTRGLDAGEFGFFEFMQSF